MTGVSRSTGVTSDAGKVVDKEIIKIQHQYLHKEVIEPKGMI